MCADAPPTAAATAPTRHDPGRRPGQWAIGRDRPDDPAPGQHAAHVQRRGHERGGVHDDAARAPSAPRPASSSSCRAARREPLERAGAAHAHPDADVDVDASDDVLLPRDKAPRTAGALRRGAGRARPARWRGLQGQGRGRRLRRRGQRVRRQPRRNLGGPAGHVRLPRRLAARAELRQLARVLPARDRRDAARDDERRLVLGPVVRQGRQHRDARASRCRTRTSSFRTAPTPSAGSPSTRTTPTSTRSRRSRRPRSTSRARASASTARTSRATRFATKLATSPIGVNPVVQERRPEQARLQVHRRGRRVHLPVRLPRGRLERQRRGRQGVVDAGGQRHPPLQRRGPGQLFATAAPRRARCATRPSARRATRWRSRARTEPPSRSSPDCGRSTSRACPSRTRARALAASGRWQWRGRRGRRRRGCGRRRRGR